ncbi:MAG TPA: hypothetical protein PLJ71_20325 [Candidatus Hydrogenedentes bacterium]|nr:hypothetical protein [Candidatus Hydrogenedentota bacterium]HQM51040.1 hypothetical protein [Candidatus Hydrogenedentota bacterium]
MKHVGRVSKTLPARAQQFDWKAALATPIQTPPLGYGELGDIALGAYYATAAAICDCVPADKQ